MKVRTTSIERIANSNSKQIDKALRAGKFSLLESFGCHKMRKEMQLVGLVCKIILWISERRARWRAGDFGKNLREEIGKLLNWGAPSKKRGVFPHINKGLVFGFNHPTLGEIIRLIAFCLTEYPNRNYLFPVNIAWYEQLAPVAKRMEVFGLYITPTITPSTREKMSKILDEEKMKIIDKLAKDFNYDYLARCNEFANNHDVIMIAPSATRKATIFDSFEQYEGYVKIEPTTMTLVAMSLERGKVLEECFFVPIAIKPPRSYTRRLNLFKSYTISPCTPIAPDTVKKYCKEKSRTANQRKFEHFFLLEIAEELLSSGAEYLVYP